MRRKASVIRRTPTIRGLIDRGRTWIKLSGAYLRSAVGAPTYGDVAKVAQAFGKAAPERMVWGSDWPHPSETERKPRNRILVQNPEALYGFPQTT